MPVAFTHRQPADPTHPLSSDVWVEATDPAVERLARAHAHFGAAVIHEMNDEAAKALEDYYQAAQEDPGDDSLVLEVSKRFLQKREFDKALEVVKPAAALPDASGAVLARLGLIYAELGKTDQALAADRAAVKKAPGQLAGYRNEFVILLQNRKTKEALEILDFAARQSSADAEFLVGLAELYFNYARQITSAKDEVISRTQVLLDRAVKLNPKPPALRLMLADFLNRLGENAKAAQIYLELLNQLPDAPEFRDRLHAELSAIYLQSADHQRAAEQLKAILHDDPANPARKLLAGPHRPRGQEIHRGHRVFQGYHHAQAGFRLAYYDLAECLLNLNQASESLATLDKARQRFAQNYNLEFLTALAFSRQKAYAQALDHFTSAEIIAQATDPKRLNEFFYFQLGATCERKGDYAQAEAYFRKSLRLAPDFAEALNYLGYMWAEHDMKLEEARALIERALKAEPENAAYLDSLGWVLFKLKQPKEALPYVLKAVSNSPKNPTRRSMTTWETSTRLSVNPKRPAMPGASPLTLEPGNAEIGKKLQGAPSAPH